MIHGCSLVLFLLFLSGGARRSIRIDGSHHNAQQQSNTLANGVKVSAEVWEALIPRGFGTGVFRRRGMQAGALIEGSKQAGLRVVHLEPHRAAPRFPSGPYRAKVALQARGGPEEGQLPSKGTQRAQSAPDVPLVARRAVFPLPLLLLSPAFASAADTFDFVANGEVKRLTELEARDALTKKVETATASGKGLDVERRGQFNEKALFSEDFYFKFGLRPSAAEVLQSPYLPPQGDLPFTPVSRRYTGYQKYEGRIQRGIAIYSGALYDAVQSSAWGDIGPLLEKGSKSRGSGKDGSGTGVAASDLRSACYALGLFANSVLQSENDSGTTTANLLARLMINELYFALDDIVEAAAEKDGPAAKAAWMRGMDYFNSYLRIVNFAINSRVGDKFLLLEDPSKKSFRSATDTTQEPAQDFTQERLLEDPFQKPLRIDEDTTQEPAQDLTQERL